MPGQTESDRPRRVYWRVGLFFEKQIEIDEPLSEEEAREYAYKHAGNIAGMNDMSITQVEVQANEW